ncbi:MAG: hypothetical protein ACRD2J_03200 [Thermoanaerobaculia bacterium]
MHTPAAAITWELFRRHRVGFGLLVVYALLLVTLQAIVPAMSEDERYNLLILGALLPLACFGFYFVGVFSFGMDGDLMARQSMYPRRMFVLPVSSGSLTFWPMFWGVASVSLLWLIFRFLTPLPPGWKLASVWPMAAMAATLMWIQAFSWMSYPVTGARIAITALVLTGNNISGMFALENGVAEQRMLALYLPQIPFAAWLAWLAVRRARRGQSFERAAGESASDASRSRRRFATPVAAQQWLEWRSFGWSLPLMVAIVLPFELLVLFGMREARGAVYEILAGILLQMPFLALFVATSMSRSAAEESRTTFFFTRPIGSAALVLSKFRVAFASTLLAWLVTIAGVTAVAVSSEVGDHLVQTWQWVRDVVGVTRASLLLAFLAAGLLLMTWKMLLLSLAIVLTGREWLIKGSAFAALVTLTLLPPAYWWAIRRDEVIEAAWDAIPLVLASLVVAKTLAGGWVALQLDRSRLVAPPMLPAAAAIWAGTVLVVYLFLRWAVPAILVPGWVLALMAIAFVPLVRIAAAPLAMDWNRHR